MSEALAFKGNVRSRLGAKQKKGKKAPIASVSASLNAPANEVALIAAKGSGKQETKKEQDKGNQGEKKKDVPVTSDGKVDVGKVFQLAVKRAFRGGAAGFAAGVVQVCTFMWLRTSMNYQYANGGTLGGAIKTLYKEGGLSRFYRGVNFAIMQAPLSRCAPFLFNPLLPCLPRSERRRPTGVADSVIRPPTRACSRSWKPRRRGCLSVSRRCSLPPAAPSGGSPSCPSTPTRPLYKCEARRLSRCSRTKSRRAGPAFYITAPSPISRPIGLGTIRGLSPSTSSRGASLKPRAS